MFTDNDILVPKNPCHELLWLSDYFIFDKIYLRHIWKISLYNHAIAERLHECILPCLSLEWAYCVSHMGDDTNYHQIIDSRYDKKNDILELSIQIGRFFHEHRSEFDTKMTVTENDNLNMKFELNLFITKAIHKSK